ncbi:hypothetical protein FDG2_2771 [Candidatus Protofrankia californiensis]|uniref:Uncharacterized protein n=1 Tax=Candidatus Protofrankia californiensis TaxID=1839754 RepID=A0A1C3NYA8_9ACTN|nr:hypothetical protein FDG2_2771 [Candidatus Protofrankia californiensis]
MSCSISGVRHSPTTVSTMPACSLPGAKKLISRSRMKAADCSGGRWLQSTRSTSKTSLDQPLGGLSVEVNLGVTAARRELEAIVWPALVKALRDDLGVGFEDHGEVGPISFGVQSPEEHWVDAVEALHHQT